MNNIVWKPRDPARSRMADFQRFVENKHQLKMRNYQQLHSWSVEYPMLFWPAVMDFFGVTFDTPASQVLNDYKHMFDATWFKGARFNYAEKLLSREDNHLALVSIDEQGRRCVLTYNELKFQVSLCAAGLKQAGITTGDRVAAYMPNVPHTIIAFLATASIGAIWASCSPDFGVEAAIDRLGQVAPKLLFISDGHQYQGKQHDDLTKISQISQLMPSLQQIVICPVLSLSTPNNHPLTITWDNFIKTGTALEFASMPFDHPLYILFSSGTTGKPKCIMHGAGGVWLQHLKELGLHTDIHQDDNLFFYTTCGWMMWNWMISLFALGATLTIYEGSPTYPDAYRLFELIESEKISVFGTSAKFLSMAEKNGVNPASRFNLDHLRCILSTGSPLLPKNYDFVYQQIKPHVQLCSISGGTDIVSCFALGNPLLPVYRGELQCIGLGMDVQVFDDNAHPVTETRGELVCTTPFPCMPVGFWNDLDKKNYHHAYFERFSGIWAHGDFAEITRHQGLIIYGRSDAILNPGGVRIGTAEIYRQVEKIDEILDCVVIGQNWQDDVRIVLFVKLREPIQLDEALQTRIRQTIRSNASPRHVPAKIVQVSDIPRTISGKVVELAVRQTVHGDVVNNLQSLANPQSLDEFKDRQELRD